MSAEAGSGGRCQSGDKSGQEPARGRVSPPGSKGLRIAEIAGDRSPLARGVLWQAVLTWARLAGRSDVLHLGCRS